jgi:4-alpha-glucanotransferase
VGEWLQAPGEKLFNRIKKRLGDLPLVAEDLGVMTEEVENLRDQFGFPGMKILQFAFDSDAGNPYLPHNYTTNFVVYTGTHDNDTTVGWFNKRSQKEQQKVTRYLGCVSGDGIHWDLIRLGMASVADIAILPLQDLFGLDTNCRMNEPGKPDGNWDWRFTAEMLTEQIGDRLTNLTNIYGRDRDMTSHN